MVLSWSFRLGTFLARRGWKYGDSRFEKVLDKPGWLLVFWAMQGMWCFITPLPLYLCLTQRRADTKPVGITDYASWTGWLLGFIVETVADQQKSAWREAGNKGWIETGLWRYSQHPNYFGEMLLWTSMCISCVNGMEGGGQKLAAIASPAFVVYLLRYVSGVPLLQRANQKRYGADPLYIAYCQRTSLLVPFPPRSV